MPAVITSMNKRELEERGVNFLVMSLIVGFLLWVLFPLGVKAAEPEVAGWIPYWQDTEGLKSATKNIGKLDTVYPFVYEVDAAGNVVDKADLEEKQWRDFLRLADREDVEVIPTIAWFDGEQIHRILSKKSSRNKLIDQIEELVDDNDFTGIDIDFEQKNPETIDHYSRFLKDLNKALGRKLVACTVEARTPPEDIYKVVPNPLRYANDYEEINMHCDRIEIMAYDQQRADLTLNDKRKGVPYVPVADNEWVEKVVDLALEDFDEDKVMLGVATYGRAWDITVAPEWYKDYKRVASLNEPRILELSKIYKSPIGRTAGGEGVISYFPEDSPYKVFNALPTPKGTPKGFEAAAKALQVATIAKIELPVRIVIWSDAEAIEAKLEIARKNDLRGIAIFKIDGEESDDTWDLF